MDSEYACVLFNSEKFITSLYFVFEKLYSKVNYCIQGEQVFYSMGNRVVHEYGLKNRKLAYIFAIAIKA